MSIHKTIRAMTLLEVIVAIIVFWVWIMVIMQMVTTNIWWIYEIRNKDTALSIAKEWIDIVYHVRDSNLERWALWNCAQIDLDAPDACGALFYEGGDSTRYTVTFDPSTMYAMESYVSTGDSTVYFHTWMVSVGWITWWPIETFWYNHDPSWWRQTQFVRYLEFKPVPWYESNTWSVLQVTSSVLYWKEYESSVVLESIVWNIR